MADWIPVEWMDAEDFKSCSLTGFSIRRMSSPFYEGEKFAALHGGFCLTKSGKLEYSRLPSSRTKAFYKRCRFDTFDDAVAAVAKYRTRAKE